MHDSLRRREKEPELELHARCKVPSQIGGERKKDREENVVGVPDMAKFHSL
jgi:hypothetical protein